MWAIPCCQWMLTWTAVEFCSWTLPKQGVKRRKRTWSCHSDCRLKGRSEIHGRERGSQRQQWEPLRLQAIKRQIYTSVPCLRMFCKRSKRLLAMMAMIMIQVWMKHQVKVLVMEFPGLMKTVQESRPLWSQHRRRKSLKHGRCWIATTLSMLRMAAGLCRKVIVLQLSHQNWYLHNAICQRVFAKFQLRRRHGWQCVKVANARLQDTRLESVTPTASKSSTATCILAASQLTWKIRMVARSRRSNLSGTGFVPTKTFQEFPRSRTCCECWRGACKRWYTVLVLWASSR